MESPSVTIVNSALDFLKLARAAAASAATVLVVDDDPNMRALVRNWLEKSDVETLEATDGVSGLAIVQAALASGTVIDCIILDVMMPGLDGFDVLERLAASPTTASIPVLLLTARAGTDDDILRAMRFGALDYVEKPFSGRVLVAKVLSAAARARHERELRNALAFAEAHAAIDPLTRLFNRQHLDLRLREEAAAAKRHQRPFAVVIVDLDFFKAVNDTFGHLEGDRVLVHVAEVMKSTLREEDCAFRYGGEEFVLVLRNCSASAGMVVAWRLRQALRDRRIRLGTELPRVITFSAGIAAADSANYFDSDMILRRADAALYRAKRAGRDRAEFEESSCARDTLEDVGFSFAASPDSDNVGDGEQTSQITQSAHSRQGAEPPPSAQSAQSAFFAKDDTGKRAS